MKGPRQRFYAARITNVSGAYGRSERRPRVDLLKGECPEGSQSLGCVGQGLKPGFEASGTHGLVSWPARGSPGAQLLESRPSRCPGRCMDGVLGAHVAEGRVGAAVMVRMAVLYRPVMQGRLFGCNVPPSRPRHRRARPSQRDRERQHTDQHFPRSPVATLPRNRGVSKRDSGNIHTAQV